jgi:hypothetical protein
VVDPVEELMGIFVAQHEPFAFGGLADEYWSLVCRSLID